MYVVMLAAGGLLWMPAAFCMPCVKTCRNPFTDVYNVAVKDTVPALLFPIRDRRGDSLSYPENNPFNLRLPHNIRDSIVYDPKEKRYYVFEKIGDRYYRTPTWYTAGEFMQLQARKQEEDYFRARAGVNNLLNRKLLHPNLVAGDNLFNRIFGNGKLELNMQGDINVKAGYQGQKTENPALPEKARRSGGFDFDMNANLNAMASIGNMLKLPINYNTLANFDFMNQMKLEYTGGTDAIIKKIEAGNISFNTKSTLIPGAQSLFGVKTQLQFGRLMVSGVLASQRSSTQSMNVQSGSATSTFQFKASDYDENRHFLLAQYFRSNYNKALRNLPVISSQVQILRAEVWVTNRTGATTNAREVVALADLGENTPANANIHSLTGLPYPFNDANDVYRNMVNSGSRQSSQVGSTLSALNLQQARDYEKVYARKLDSTSYKIYPQLGFISLSQTLQSNDVLAVAYQYSYNGRIYQVGEFSQDVPPDTSNGSYSGTQKVLFVKLLKATAVHTELPLWNLMMKNVYSIKNSAGTYISSIQSEGFKLNILYDEPGKGSKRYLPEGSKYGVPLISVLNLDRLNSQNDPSPDGIFDYVEGYTINATNGWVIFPLLEPFGRDLDSLAFPGNPALSTKYIYSKLYDTIKAVAQTYANFNRYVISGSARGQSNAELSLNALNVPQGSVTVTAGGQKLTENVDYSVDYNMGTVKILNQAILNSGVPVQVQYENNGASGLQQKGLLGLRLDYQATQKPGESLSIGATIERLSERPFFTKVSYNEDPIKNTMYGLDVNYFKQSPKITHWLNRLPFYNTKETSTITAYGETAVLQPGHPRQIGKGNSGTIYIDDFEGSTSEIDLRYPVTNWALASTPQGNGLFPEATSTDALEYGYNRASIAWYNIETNLQSKSSTDNPVRSYENFADPRIAAVIEQQLFPNKTSEYGTNSQLVTFDVAYYPTERGPYNFDARAGSTTADGKLLNPQKRWGGIMRAIDQSDFETSNIQYVEFWMLDPFVTNPSGTGGKMYLDLGSVSEDILKDQKRQYENGLSTPATPASSDTSVWGKVPLNAIQVTNSFSADASERPYQDVGFDGLNDDSERIQFKTYLDALAAQFGTGSAAYQHALNDPANDNYRYFRDDTYDASKTGILGRYKHINGTQGNSPVAGSGDKYVSAFTLYPDEEDLDKDNSMNELESYFEYKVDLSPATLITGSNFITDKRTFTPGGGVTQTWYQFRIPVDKYEQAVGGIADFKSIRFIRMFLTGFSDSVVCRFASFNLVRNAWRTFDYQLDTTGTYTAIPATSSTTMNVTSVNIEQNSSRSPVPYVLPPGIQRQEYTSNSNTTVLQNEQAMSLQVCNLAPGDARGVYKNVTLDLRRYGKLDLFVHVEGTGSNDAIADGQLYAVMRLGSDFISNFYEIKIPLKKTNWGASADVDIWPSVNDLQLSLQDLTQLKTNRNKSGASNVYYQERAGSGRILAIFGNPSLAQIEAFFVGVQNYGTGNACAELWFDELRLSDINEKGGWAAVGKVDMKLADLGTVNLAGSYKSAGFGSIDQHINERSMNNAMQLDGAANLELGKLLPAKAGVSIPVYAGISKTLSTPEYDPFDSDIKLKDKLKSATAAQRDSIREQAVNSTEVRTLNFTGVRKNNITGKKLKPWSIENFDLNYSVTITDHHDSVTEADQLKYYKASLGYNYSSTPTFKTPFKNLIKSRSPWFALLKDFNFNLLPTNLGFNYAVNRQWGMNRSRNIGGLKGILPETYNKYFRLNRTYNLHWDLTKSLALEFSAINSGVVDEDSGKLDKAGRQQMWDRFLKGGRNTLYQHQAGATYTLPTSKLPLLNWTNIHADYRATYSWTAASRLATSLGNTLQNTQQKSITAQFNFNQLYNKSALLRSLQDDGGPPQPVAPSRTDTTHSRNGKKKQPKVFHISGPVKGLLNALLSIKQVNIQYSENGASTIYGYMDSTRLLGMNLHSMQPGWKYVFGAQPNAGFTDKLVQKGLLTHDTTFNMSNLQTLNQQLTVNAQVQPVRDLTIDISLTKSFGRDFTELVKDTTGANAYGHLNQSTTGMFEVSFLSMKTLFKRSSGNIFQQFENNRIIISERLGTQNPYSGTRLADGYYKGYGKYSQDVLIPAFIAAYTGKDASKIALVSTSTSNIRNNPFAGYLPKPNWRITYNGFTRIPGLDKIFRTFTLGHAYNGKLSVGSFSSSLYYKDPNALNYPGFIDTATGNFYPYFTVPTITITENFTPLLSVDMLTVNDIQANIEYNKTRTLSLSLIDYQMTEMRSSNVTFGLGWRKRNMPLPFHIQLQKRSVQGDQKGNDVTMKLDMSITDNETVNHYLDQENAVITGGTRVVRISPSVNMVVSNRVNLKFYYDRQRTVPKISTSVPITTVSAGVQVSIVLAK